LESIKRRLDGDMTIHWKTHSLEQEDNDSGYSVWEHPEDQTHGVLALVAAKAAQNQGDLLFGSFHMGVFRARHENHKNIADKKVLAEIAEKIGLDVPRLEKDMERRETWEAVGQDHTESVETYDAFGVPTVVFPGNSAVFIKLDALPEDLDERVSLYRFILDMAVSKPYLHELKRS